MESLVLINLDGKKSKLFLCDRISKCTEGLNRPNNFEVFSELIIQVLLCGEMLTDILLKVVME